ncbi:MAG: hypothetical protein VB860_04185 [Dehalococcoidia bacterium]
MTHVGSGSLNLWAAHINVTFSCARWNARTLGNSGFPGRQAAFAKYPAIEATDASSAS